MSGGRVCHRALGLLAFAGLTSSTAVARSGPVILRPNEKFDDELRLPLAVEGEQRDIRGLAWLPSKPKAVILALHGIQSYCEWYGPLGVQLKKRDIAIYALERRGSGAANSFRKPGDIEDWKTWIRDIDVAADEVHRRHPGQPVYLLGTSWGAKTALGTLVDDAARFGQQNQTSRYQGAILCPGSL